MSHATHADSHSAHEAHDSHGHEHKGHVIVGPFMLRTVLAFLLFFTALTVGVSVGEQWIMGYFNIELPWWVNVFGAMSIALVKAILVMAIFMQLRWDNPMNTVVMLFTAAALAIFLFFTGLDLFSRGRIYEYKAGPVMPGGNRTTVNRVMQAKDDFKQKIRTANPGWTEDQIQQEFNRLEAKEHAAHGGGHDTHGAHHGANPNTASRTRPLVGLTGALDTAHSAPAHNADSHADHAPAASEAKHEPGHK